MYVCIFIKDAQVVVRRHRDNGNRDWSQIRDAAFFVEWKYPWVAEAWSIEEKYVAIGPNPARLANLCRGVELSSANCTNISRATEQTFLEMVTLTREFMPTSFRATFESGLVIVSTHDSLQYFRGATPGYPAIHSLRYYHRIPQEAQVKLLSGCDS